MDSFSLEGLTELHAHVGGSVAPEIMWGLAHTQGIKLKTKDYWSFVKAITVDESKHEDYSKYLELFDLTELIQSSPEGMETSAYSIVGGAYRSNNIRRLEMRFNPMLRNRGGERDLDQIILATIRGIERATLEYPVQAGLIIMFDRRFSLEKNEILLEKAIKYKNRGVIGIDVGGPASKDFKMSDLAGFYEKAARAGLGLTAHAGEELIDDLTPAITELKVSRVGHGIKCVTNPSLLKLVRDHDVTLEVCPTSNLLGTRVVKSLADFKRIIATLLKEEVKFTINTDGPEMLRTNLRKEREFLIKNEILSQRQLDQCEVWARQASFLPRKTVD